MEPSGTDLTDPAVVRALMPFAAANGVTIQSASAEAVVGRLDWAPERCTAGGVLHGAAIVTLADSVAAACAFLNLPPGAGTATTESTTHFLRAVRDGHVEATSRVLHGGRTSIVVETEVRDAAGRLVAHTLQSQAVLAARGGQ